jgi:hypothetical protein
MIGEIATIGARAAKQRLADPGTARIGPIETIGLLGQTRIASARRDRVEHARPRPRAPRGGQVDARDVVGRAVAREVFLEWTLGPP